MGVWDITTGEYETHHPIFRYPSAIPLPSYPRVPAYGHRSHRAPRKGGGLLIGPLWYVSPSRAAIAIPGPYRMTLAHCPLTAVSVILHNRLAAIAGSLADTPAIPSLNATK